MHASARGPGLRRARRGSTLVETALTLPVFVAMLMGVFECGRALMYRHLLAHAARTAARAAVVGVVDRTPAEIEAEARAGLAGFDDATTRVRAYRADANGVELGPWSGAAFGQGIAVRVETTLRPVMPGLGLVTGPIRMSAVSIQHSEGE